MAVCRFEERCVSLPYSSMGVASDDTAATAEIKARCAVTESEQGRGGLRVAGFHENAPCRSFGGRCGNAHLRSLGGESLMSQSRVHLAAAHISTYVECEEPSKSCQNQLRTNLALLAAMLLACLRLCR